MSFMTPEERVKALEALEERQQRLQKHAAVSAWVSVAVAAVVLVGLISFASARLSALRGETANLFEEKKKLENDIAKLETERDTLNTDKIQYRAAAGVKVVCYRQKDVPLAQKVSRSLKFQWEVRDNVRLATEDSNTLAYGPEVTTSDCKALAEELIRNGFPLRAIRPAERTTEARLLQIYGSARSNGSILTADEIENGPYCGAGVVAAPQK